MTRNKKLTAAVVATILTSWLGIKALEQAPVVEPDFGVTSPITRGFGSPCDSDDFTQARFFNFGLRTWNKGALLPLQAAVRVVERKDGWVPASFSGTYNCRPVRGSSTWSHHAWAVAVDFDAPNNCLGCAVSSTTIGRHPEFVRAFTRFGFVWGGSFSRPDAMHFEYDGPALPIVGDRFPDGWDKDDLLAKALQAVGLKATRDGRYAGAAEFASVLAFQKRNHLLGVDPGGQVRAPTWTLLLLEAKG